MGKTRQEIDAEVERTLQSIDEIKPVEGNSYLYTRIRERMQEQRTSPPSHQRVAGWRLALATLLLLVNIGSAYVYYQKSIQAKQAIGVETLAGEYGLDGQEW